MSDIAKLVEEKYKLELHITKLNDRIGSYRARNRELRSVIHKRRDVLGVLEELLNELNAPEMEPEEGDSNDRYHVGASSIYGKAAHFYRNFKLKVGRANEKKSK